jgi:hypothetical protein
MKRLVGRASVPATVGGTGFQPVHLRNFFRGLPVIKFGETGSFTKFPLFLSKKIGGVNTGGNGGGANFPPGPRLDSGGRGRL